LFRWLFIADSEILAITRIREKYSAQQKKLKGDEIMKKLLFIGILIAFLLIALPAMAAKPAGNLASAKTYAWHLSGAVMPVPPQGPYGTLDIPGSDIASKLIVNQPNGNTEVAITGVMNGLKSSTPYTVYLSNGYIPYVDTGWSITGNWVMQSLETYNHDCTLVQSSTAFTGTCNYPAYPIGGPYVYTEKITGTINPMTGEISSWHGVYYTPGDPTPIGYTYDATGTIQSDGKFIGWVTDGTNSGSWNSISGAAQKTHTGDTGWTQLFTNTVPPFTFMTDAYGSGSWHVNLRDADLTGTGPFTISVWINDGGTLLISDNFVVVKG
jgi:hypothetical protein